MPSDEPIESQAPSADRVPVSYERARSRRLELGQAAVAVEEVVARPRSDPMWAERVLEQLAGLRAALADHVEEVERADGLLSRVRDDAPRLTNAVSTLVAEHEEMDRAIGDLTSLVEDCAPGCDLATIEQIRAWTLDALALVSRHRQAGADLVYEAYNVDIGGG